MADSFLISPTPTVHIIVERWSKYNKPNSCQPSFFFPHSPQLSPDTAITVTVSSWLITALQSLHSMHRREEGSQWMTSYIKFDTVIFTSPPINRILNYLFYVFSTTFLFIDTLTCPLNCLQFVHNLFLENRHAQNVLKYKNYFIKWSKVQAAQSPIYPNTFVFNEIILIYASLWMNN